MKKLLILLALLSLLFLPAMASEIEPANNGVQETDIDASGVVLVVNKQPRTSENDQVVKVRRSGFVFIINCNGKVQVNDKSEN